MNSILATILRIIWAFVVVIVILLCIRFVLSLIGANADNEFAAFIYDITYAFVAPFQGLLQVSESQIGVGRVEYETLVAIVVYLLLGGGLTAIINAFRR